ncbi:murein DD-endopeptidase MepM/ murein hydrolase activator NlpD [Kitasatospora sp. MAP5-34]|nr:murein DD-endopeptidase MepM/ murein hydrolase activator NlpD [Kitasatospora sp. MAP5-34]
MPALGNHSRTRLPRLARIGVTAALAASAFALPLVGAVSAHAAPVTVTASAVNSAGFTAPLNSLRITEAYGVLGHMWASGHHTGVDFAASVGTSVKAVGNGTVVTAGNGGAYGNQIVIKLADGHYAQYAHLSSIQVHPGQTVQAGQQIGLSGATGNVTGPHLHFEIRTTPNYGSDIDPVAYLRAHAVTV